MQEYEEKIGLRSRILASSCDIFDGFLARDRRGGPRQGLAMKVPDIPLRVLDVASGTAESAIALAEKNPENNIIGINLSPDMIVMAMDKIHRLGIQNVTIRPMDPLKTDFRDGEFDVVVISFALHDMDYDMIMAVLREMRRVLKSSGRLYIVDYDRKGSFLKRPLFWAYLKISGSRHVRLFLMYDWEIVLKEAGFRVSGIDRYPFSKVISASRCEALGSRAA